MSVDMVTAYDQRLGEEARVRRWRLEYALGLGYDVIPAEVIAGSAIDMHELQDLLAAGCARDLAIRVLA